MVVLVSLTKWIIAAALGVAALASVVLVAPLVLVYFLYSRSLDFAESFRAKPAPAPEPGKNMFNLASLALSAFKR